MGVKSMPEYTVWKSMRARCNNPNNVKYKYYGERGIEVCEEWDCPGGFNAFLEDMGKRPSDKHTLERDNNNGNYEPDNCFWGTRRDQSRNKRNNVIVKFNGKSQCLTDWANEIGISPRTLDSRIKSGWSIEDTLTKPSQRKK